MAAQVNVVAITDQLTLRVSEVLNALRMMKKEGVELMDPLIITQSLSQGALPVESSSADFVVDICRSCEVLNDQLFIEILRVLKHGGSILLRLTSQYTAHKLEKSSIERKLLLAGFLDVEASEAGHVIGVSLQKNLLGRLVHLFQLRKKKSLPAVIIDEDMDLIDEYSLLIEEDLKKPQVPVGDCEVGKTRKACKNCTCGQAEKEGKIGLTMDLLQIPQSACGNVYSSTIQLAQTMMFSPIAEEVTTFSAAQLRDACLQRTPVLESLEQLLSDMPVYCMIKISEREFQGEEEISYLVCSLYSEEEYISYTPPPRIQLIDSPTASIGALLHNEDTATPSKDEEDVSFLSSGTDTPPPGPNMQSAALKEGQKDGVAIPRNTVKRALDLQSEQAETATSEDNKSTDIDIATSEFAGSDDSMKKKEKYEMKMK